MRATYRINGKNYVFAFLESDPDGIFLVKEANTDNEKTIYIPVKKNDNYVIKVNKKSISGIDGAYGVFKFLKKAIDESFLDSWCNVIINQF